MRFVEEGVALVGIAERGHHEGKSMDERREILTTRGLGRLRERLAQVLGSGVELARRDEDLRERQMRTEVTRLRGQQPAQPAFRTGDVAIVGLLRRTLHRECRTRIVELATQRIVVGRELGSALERAHRGAMIARLAGAPRRRCDVPRSIGVVGERRCIAQEGRRVNAWIRIGRRGGGDPLERGQILGRRRKQLLEYSVRRRAIVAAVLEDPCEPQPQRCHVIGRRAAIVCFGHARTQDVGGLAALTTAREHLRVIDEAADVLRRVARCLRDEGRGLVLLACLLERPRLRAQQGRLLHAAGRALGTLAAHGRDIAPAPQLGQQILECAPRLGIRGPPRHDHAVDRGRTIEATVVAVELPRSAQRGTRAIVVGELSDALERLGGLRPRAGTAIQPREAIESIHVIGIDRDDLLHRRDRLERLIEVLVDVGELLVERSGTLGVLRRGARLISEQHGELFPQPVLRRDRAKPATRLGIPRCMTHLGDRDAQHLDRIRRCVVPSGALPAPGAVILRHRLESLP